MPDSPESTMGKGTKVLHEGYIHRAGSYKSSKDPSVIASDATVETSAYHELDGNGTTHPGCENEPPVTTVALDLTKVILVEVAKESKC